MEKNISLVSKELGLSNIIKLQQIHSSNVIIIDKNNLQNNFYKGDGLVTNQKNIGLSILGADCAPILFYDSKKNIILGDEISPDNCRLWDLNQKNDTIVSLDKDRFRNDLGGLIEAYSEIYQRIKDFF